MPQLNKKLALIILSVLLALVAIGFIFLSQKKLFLSRITPTQPSPTPTPGRLTNVMYPLNPDPSGRNIYYLTSDLGRNIKFAGAGWIKLSSGSAILNDKGNTLIKVSSTSALTDYIVGSFQRWEEIPGSKDKYLIIDDLMKVRTLKGELIPIPKIRIGFGTTKDIGKKASFFTAIGVEDLSSVIPKVIDRKTKAVKHYKFGLIGDLSTTDLNILIRPQDALTVIISPNLQKQQDLTDNQGQIIASSVFIRRFNPLETLPKELSRSLTFHE